MQMKRLAALCICICSLALLFAGGNKETEEKDIADSKSWQETFDINGKKAGKYNIVVTATDEGGNVSLAGPMNIYIDPDSDLPVAGITNPLDGMRVPGNLNIVGTCIDDDAVSQVEIILDGDAEHPVIAEGREFWSYYLDTTHLSEGIHTVEVTGVDIHGVRGNRRSVSWHLDRKQPSVAVENYALGQLVSGKIRLAGTVRDGNGIKSLAYSIDGGGLFVSVPLKTEKDKETGDTHCTFELTVDTAALEDGPAVCWFKATDMQGTVGVYSFLFFIDNTCPEIKIVSPADGEAVNGKFSVAGYAKDIIGIQNLSWSFLDSSGEMELIAGNPFWCIDLDVLGKNVKSGDLQITAQDTAGNISRIKQRILIDAAADLARVDVRRPAVSEILYSDIILEGIASDDDGISSVVYKIDNGAENVLECDGVFVRNISEQLNSQGTPVQPGAHTVHVWAVDSDGTPGTPVAVPFTVADAESAFSNITVTGADGSVRPYVPGIEIHPESKSVISMQTSSVCGITSYVRQFDGRDAQTVELKTPSKGTVSISIPVDDTRWGYTELTVAVTDSFGRTVNRSFPFYITDLTATRGESAVVFAGIGADAAGVVVNGAQKITGYFRGGAAASARIVPETPVATVSLDGNSLTIEPGAETGISDVCTVEVTTVNGIVYRSKEMRLCNKTAVPVVTIENSGVYSGFEPVAVSGSVQSSAKEIALAYRIIRSGSKTDAVSADEWVPVPGAEQLDGSRSGSNAFSFVLPPELFGEGAFAVEIQATDMYGSSAAGAVFVSSVRKPEPGADGKVPSPARPAVYWYQSEYAVYYLIPYSGELKNAAVAVNGAAVSGSVYGAAGRIANADMPSGTVAVEVSVADEQDRTYSGRYTAKKPCTGTLVFDRAGNMSYRAGMEVAAAAVPQNQGGTVLTAGVEADGAVTSAGYRINGGAAQKAAIRKTGGTHTEFDIPLDGLAADIAEIEITAQLADGSVLSATGHISIVRKKDAADISEHGKVYWKDMPENGMYSLTQSDFAMGFADFTGTLGVSFEKETPGLSVSVSGRQIVIMPLSEGEYRGVVVLVTDGEGIVHKAPPVSVSADFSKPELIVAEPAGSVWVQNSVALRGTVFDNSAIEKAEYSLDGGESWLPLQLLPGKDAEGRIRFENTADISALPDGLVEIIVRIADHSGKEAEQYIAVHKDTVAPEVFVVVPEAGMTINGETRLVFKIADNGRVEKREYIRIDTVKNEKGADVTTETRLPIEARPLTATLVGLADRPIAQDMIFSCTDAAGNETRISEWDFTIDAESDKPVAEIHVPAEMEVIQTDFIISGIVYDDDGPGKIWYRIDDAEFVAIEGTGTSFSIPVPLASMTDNEHTVTVYAEDIHGVRGDETVRTFRISLEEPKAAVLLPVIDQTVRERVTVTGTASDKNGVAKVQISLDNGNSYNDAVGTDEWSYEFDSRIIQDGTHVVFVKVFDAYGIEGLYSSLLNIDNTAPDIRLELPLDGSRSTGMVFFSGQTTDNIGLAKLYLTVHALDLNTPKVPDVLSYIELDPDEIITKGIDISVLADGKYNFEISGEDAGGNVRRVSRNIELNKTEAKTKIDILYPLNGEHVQGMFNLYGKVVSEVPVQSLFLYIDDQEAGMAEVSRSGYYKFTVSPEIITAGEHRLFVRGITADDTVIPSGTQTVLYTPAGPWITVDNFTMGDFAVDRPYIEGSAGYAFTEAELLELRAKETAKERREELAAKAVDRIEISFDNGKTFQKTGTTLKWRYRVENTEIAEGYHFMIVRAVMKNGERAVTRSIIQIDKTAPFIRLISPGEGGRFNETIEFAGLTSDDVALKNVVLALRSGDKASYEVPSFIQGLYFDWHFWGATLYDIGAGLTFFDDNVKLQVQFGQMTQSQYNMLNNMLDRSEGFMRYGGNVIGAKLLANIGHLPFRYFFGPDWEWLSASFALGANFSSFSETQSGKSQMLSAVLGQIEFPRISLSKQKHQMFRTFSLYTELQLWFIPTDIESAVDIESMVFQISGGIRVNVF